MAKKKPIVSKYGQWKYPGQETIIPDANGRITMQGVPYPVFGIDDQGNQQMMMPGQEYKFPGNSVYEIPLTDKNIMARGFDRGSGKSTGVAQPKELTKEQRALDDWQRLTSNGSSTFEKRIPAPDDKTYQQLLSRSQGGPSSSDKGIFLGAYKQVGGQLVPHDISVPNLSRQKGGPSYDIPAQSYRNPNVVREEGREWYDPVSETIYMQPSYPNVIHEQMVKDHELEHHKQKLKGKLSSTEYWPGPLKEPAVGASDEMTYPYYNRAGQDVRNLMNAAPQSSFFGIPEDVAVTGFQNKTYDTPGTAEYDAENPNEPRTLYRGKPVVKNAVAKTLNREEKDPEMMFKDKYNTELTKEEQKDFDKWAEQESKQQGRDIMMDKGAYDIQGFWKSGDWKKKDADNHGTDTWKKPNHPTFSNQSKYNGEGGLYGGNWTEDAGYQPSKQSLNNYGPDYYNWMFGEEPNRPEYLDMSRYDGTNSPTPVVYKHGGSVKKVKIKSLPKNWKSQ